MRYLLKLVYIVSLLPFFVSCKSNESIISGDYSSSWNGGCLIHVNILSDSTYNGIYINNSITELHGKIRNIDILTKYEEDSIYGTRFNQVVLSKNNLFFIPYIYINKRFKLNRVSKSNKINFLVSYESGIKASNDQLFENNVKSVSFEYTVFKKKVFYQKSIINIFSDGSFSINKFSSTGNNFVKGRWHMVNNVIILNCIWENLDDEALNDISSVGFHKFYGIVCKRSNFYLGSTKLKKLRYSQY